jgi:hypothetical protein
MYNTISSGQWDLKTGSRFLIEFWTNNELDPVYGVELTGSGGTDENYLISCNGLRVGNSKPMPTING